MAKSKPPRKKYRPRECSTLSPWRAITNASLLPAAEAGRCAQVMWTAFDNLKRGQDPATQIDILADVLNIAENLADVGICSDETSRQLINWAQLCLVEITQRLHASGTSALRSQEIRVIDEGLTRYVIQLQNATHGEYEEALRRTVARMQAALRGDLPGVKTLRAVSPAQDNKNAGA
jgi:hypothetical protein